MSAMPTHAHLPRIGRVRVLEYWGNGYFFVLDQRDVRRFVHRRRLLFERSARLCAPVDVRVTRS